MVCSNCKNSDEALTETLKLIFKKNNLDTSVLETPVVDLKEVTKLLHNKNIIDEEMLRNFNSIINK